MMNKTYSIMGLALGASLAVPGCMEGLDDAAPASTAHLEAPGHDWIAVAPGVWQRHGDHGRVSTYAVGAAGSQWMLPQLEAAGATLEQAYQRESTEERWDQVLAHRQMMAELTAELAVAEVSEPAATSSVVALSGNYDFGGTVNAYPRTTSSAGGIGATASAHYWTDYYRYPAGGVYTYALAEVDTAQNVKTCDWRYGYDVSCSSTATLVGDSSRDCYAQAIARVRDHWAYGYYWMDEQFECGDPIFPDICEIKPWTC